MTTQTFINGKIFTSTGENDFATAFTITDGIYEWVGSSEDADHDGAIDLQGKTVLPGLIDIHTHPSYVAMTLKGIPCTVPMVYSIEEMLDALRTHPNYGKGENDWIEGWGWDESKLAEGRAPTRHDLDKVSNTQPIYVMRSDCHSGVCNTRALELASIHADTPNPEGAEIVREADGVTPNGVLREHAANDMAMRAKQDPSYENKVAGIHGTGAHYNERGIVAVTDMMVFQNPFNDMKVYRDAESMGLRQQVPLYFAWSEMQHGDKARLSDGIKQGRTKFAGVKLFADGSISGKTAWVSEAYKGEPENFGFKTITEEELASAYEFARENSVQISVHVMGDKSIQWIIDFFSDKQSWMGGEVADVRLEHVTMLTVEQMKQMRASNIVWGGSTQIIFFFAEYDSYSASLTDNQFSHTYPVRDYYENYPYFGLSSDAPATTWADPDNVFVSIQAAVTRKAYNGADIVAGQAISVPQAVLLYTARPAKVAPYEGKLGQIAQGYEGSFVVLDQDIFSVDANSISATQVDQTWIQGEKVYDRA